MKKKLDIILPRFREEEQILRKTIQDFENYFALQDLDPHFIISQNGPHQRIEINGKNISNLHIADSGLGHALKNASQVLRGEWFFFTSPDNPFAFTDLEQMLRLKAEFDLIIGSKLHPKSSYKAPLKRKLFSYLQNLGTKTLLPGFPVLDPSGTLFGTRASGETFSSLTSGDYFISTELIWHLHRGGKKIHEVPVTYHKVDAHSSVNIKKYALDSIKNLARIRMGEKG